MNKFCDSRHVILKNTKRSVNMCICSNWYCILLPGVELYRI